LEQVNQHTYQPDNSYYRKASWALPYAPESLSRSTCTR